jgi:hypothetical protein
MSILKVLELPLQQTEVVAVGLEVMMMVRLVGQVEAVAITAALEAHPIRHRSLAQLHTVIVAQPLTTIVERVEVVQAL